jgi:hypothetical protein
MLTCECNVLRLRSVCMLLIIGSDGLRSTLDMLVSKLCLRIREFGLARYYCTDIVVVRCTLYGSRHLYVGDEHLQHRGQHAHEFFHDSPMQDRTQTRESLHAVVNHFGTGLLLLDMSRCCHEAPHVLTILQLDLLQQRLGEVDQHNARRVQEPVVVALKGA